GPGCRERETLFPIDGEVPGRRARAGRTSGKAGGWGQDENRMINLKTAHEIDLMARAGSLLASVLPPLKEACEPGVKTIELDGIDKARPGGFLGDISSAIQKHVEAAGFSVIRQFVGHGIGRQMHEDPQVPNFGTAGTPPRLKPGMTLAIEPMVNAGTHEVYMKPDGWTICTADGALSAYFEHTVAITEKGPIVLTKGALD